MREEKVPEKTRCRIVRTIRMTSTMLGGTETLSSPRGYDTARHRPDSVLYRARRRNTDTLTIRVRSYRPASSTLHDFRYRQPFCTVTSVTVAEGAPDSARMPAATCSVSRLGMSTLHNRNRLQPSRTLQTSRERENYYILIELL